MHLISLLWNRWLYSGNMGKKDNAEPSLVVPFCRLRILVNIFFILLLPCSNIDVELFK